MSRKIALVLGKALVNHLPETTRVKYGYNRASNRQWRQNTVFGTGLDEYYEFKYDAWNRLIEIKVPGGAVLSTHQYDGASRRVTKLGGSVTRHYYYYSDQWQVLEERTGSSTSVERWFVWGVRLMDDLVRRERDSEPLYVLGDALNVTAVINASGIVQERYGYTGFGTVRYMNASFGSIGSSGRNWDTLFGSYRYDTESGLYQVRYRFLHPALGRWITRDPIGEDGGAKLYSYVSNVPVDFIDPFGLIKCPNLESQWPKEEANTVPFFPFIGKATICAERRRRCFERCETKYGEAVCPGEDDLSDAERTERKKACDADCLMNFFKCVEKKPKRNRP